MAPSIFLSALLAAIATPAPAQAPAQAPGAAARNAANDEVILSQYPERARAAGEQGSVGFKVALDRDGFATSCEVTQSSGYKRLDQETCDLILNRATFKGVRGSDGRKRNMVTTGIVNWRLPGAAPIVASPIRIAATPVPEKKFCRRKVKTGSLADYERHCATAAEWSRMTQQTQREWGALQGTLGSTHGQ
jgi:TonB family protein